MRKSPVTVQQWVDSLPPSNTRSIIHENNPHNCHSPKLIRGVLARDASIQSDEISLCSSLESMLELRRPDPEAVLLGLGFGPSQNDKSVSRIPQRFLNPSKVSCTVW
uniref:ITPR-interacting domain-containing protein n=1 Tax=Photinus pyralis TaxID=7054 RepID=A0A1Y1LKS7_PHOPY